MSEADWDRQIDDAHARLERAKESGEPHFILKAYVVSTQEGGRRKPVFSYYRPQLWIGQRLETGEAMFWDCSWLLHERQLDPGCGGEVTLFISPRISPRTLSVGEHLEFYEGQRLVAAAEVTERHLTDS
jgi:translation elongation factor EF-Tu-like GTPase